VTEPIKTWEVVVVREERIIYRIQAVDGGDATAMAVGKATLGRRKVADGVVHESTSEPWQMVGLEEVRSDS
jgi:hypothetical protein